MTILAVLVFVYGCAGEPVAPRSSAEDALKGRAWLEAAPSASGGRLAVQVEYPRGKEVVVEPPVAEGLTFETAGPPRREAIGDRWVETTVWSFQGDGGHYEVRPGSVRASDALGPSIPISSLFVDLGVEPVRPAEIADIEEPARLWSVPWRGLAVAGGLSAASAAVGGWYLRRRRPAPIAVAVEPPDVIALRAWDSVRSSPALDAHAKALELSRIFREYAEEVLRFPATAWTTTESLAYLTSLPHLAAGNVPRAKRMLRATDRVKYAEVETSEEWLEEWDADLRAFVASTRPRGWDEVQR